VIAGFGGRVATGFEAAQGGTSSGSDRLLDLAARMLFDGPWAEAEISSADDREG
jgi:hypothetical protein